MNWLVCGTCGCDDWTETVSYVEATEGRYDGGIQVRGRSVGVRRLARPRCVKCQASISDAVITEKKEGKI